MKINTIRFGEIEIEQDKVITFETGPLGFEGKTKWVVVDNGLLGWLQSLEDPELAFVVTNPFEFYGDYDFHLNDNDINALNISEEDNLSVLSIVSVPPKVENMTVNLLAPIVINLRENKAKQIILNNVNYSVRHYVYNDLLKIKDKKEKAVNA